MHRLSLIVMAIEYIFVKNEKQLNVGKIKLRYEDVS